MSQIEHNLFYKNNRLQQLRGFCAVMRFGSFSQAGKQLNLSHAAISLQIKSLENDLKVKLFERKGPKIKPTTDADMLYKIAMPQVERMNDIYNEFVTLKNEETSNEIRIAANNSALNYILPKLLEAYLKEYPKMNVRIIFAEQEDGLKLLKEDKIDVLILPRREHNPIERKYFEYMPMFYYVPVLLSLPGHPLAGQKKLTIEDICQHEITLPSKGLTVIPYLDDILNHYKKPKKLKITFENWSNTLKFIEAGLVVGIVADLSHERHNDKLHRTPLTHLFPVIDYGLVVRNGSRSGAKIRQFYEVARQNSLKLSSDILPAKFKRSLEENMKQKTQNSLLN